MIWEACMFLMVIVITEVDCKYCWYTTNFGKTSHFYCGAFEYCCKEKCCENFDEFYKLWYFWLCVLIMVVSCAIALYWLRRRYHVFRHPQEERPTQHHRRRHRRYRHLPGDGNSAANRAPMIPASLVITPPPYHGDNTGVPHPGPPPYTLGSASSMNSRTLPRCPPAYCDVVKEAPPSYTSTVELSLPETELKKDSADVPS